MRNLLSIFRILLLVVAGGVSVLALGGPTGSPVSYRLLSGSSLTSDSTGLDGQIQSQTSALTGPFSLTPQTGPLDWNVYSLDGIQWVLTDTSGNSRGVSGDGTYSVTERFGNTKDLTLTLQIAGLSVSLDSGAVPNDQNWPVVDIVATGVSKGEIGNTHYSLHLIAAPQLQVWHYRLIGDSSFLDECLVCDRVSIPQPMRGGFDLVLIDTNPVQSRYLLRDINFSAGAPGETRTLTGQGSFQFGGEVALQQTMTLQLTVQSSAGIEAKTFTNATSEVNGLWPMVDAYLYETTGSPGHFYELHLRAAPLREIWFSTSTGLTSGSDAISGKRISDGDVLSDLGGVVERNLALMRPFGLNPDITAGIDAFTIVPGGDVQFSLNNDFSSSTFGQIQNGDLLSAQGGIVETNQDLLRAFGLMPIPPNVGLDAIQVLDDGEILFSITQTAFSESKSLTLNPGDLLSSQGEIKKTNQQLLSAFHPDQPGHDYGLDAVYVWPSGEIWFSTAEGFNDQQLGDISDGDLLSDQGYLVFRNLELVSALVPLEKLANFGLDALYVVTDVSSSASAPNLLGLGLDRAGEDLTVSWSAKGRVFQVEKTMDLTLPFTPASPILTGTNWTDLGALRLNSPAFYRLRQW